MSQEREGGTPATAADMGIMVGSPPERIVDMTRWDKGPDNRWAFQHISEIIPTADISRGGGAPSDLPEARRDVTGIRFKVDGVETSVGEALAATYTDAFLVLVDGAIIFDEYWNGMRPDTRHLLMSVSKSVTGTLAGLLVTDGYLDPEAPLVHYIPELQRSPGFAETTVRQVLDMTTAIQFSEDYDDPTAEVVVHEEACAWRYRTPVAEAGLYAFAQTVQRADRAHGELFHYASINTDVLGWLIERATGQRFVEYMSDALWSKLGAGHDAQISVDHHGSAVANGGFCITARDLGRFGQMMLDGGRYNGEQIVPAEWIDDIRHNGPNSAWAPTHYGSIWPDGNYRNQWYVIGDDHGAFFAIGVNGQHIWIDPTTRAVIIKFSSVPDSVDIGLAELALGAIEAVARSFDSDDG
jgi:hypothetical protein